MDAFNRLINQKVIATIEIDEEDYDIEGIVTNVDVNDFYFYEKGEPIYVSVAINPTKELPSQINMEDVIDIPLEKIRKAY